MVGQAVAGLVIAIRVGFEGDPGGGVFEGGGAQLISGIVFEAEGGGIRGAELPDPGADLAFRIIAIAEFGNQGGGGILVFDRLQPEIPYGIKIAENGSLAIGIVQGIQAVGLAYIMGGEDPQGIGIGDDAAQAIVT